MKFMISRLSRLVKARWSTTTSAAYVAKLCVRFGVVRSALGASVTCQLTGQIGAPQSSRHARHAVTSQSFLKFGGREQVVHRRRRPTRRCERRAVDRKPLICRHFRIDVCIDRGVCAVQSVRGTVTPAPYTLGFWRRNQGVGLAFVTLRGYGRPRWLVLGVS